MPKSLADLLGQGGQAAPPQSDAFFAKFGLGRNPFPTARTIIPEVIYNQEAALTVFAKRVADIINPQAPQKRSMAIWGGTGSGKTHFLRHCQHLLTSHPQAEKLVIVEFLAGTSSIPNLLREMLRAADDVCKKNGELNLLTAVTRSMENERDTDAVSFAELRMVLQRLRASTYNHFIPPDRDGRVGSEQLRDLATKWMSGSTMSQTERKYLGVYSRLATSSLMARVISELFSFAYARGIISGVVIFLDEVEALFTGQNTTSKIQQFLQDLRFLFDEAIKDGRGYSLFVLSASTQTGAVSLRDFNYPLFQRLGNESRYLLLPISSLEEAQEFSAAYIEYERDRSRESRRRDLLLTDGELKEAYEQATKGTRASKQFEVSQAQLLEALNEAVERKREHFWAAVNR